MRQLRLAPRPRVRRRPGAGRAALLHQLAVTRPRREAHRVAMKIAVVGKGNVGGGLADFWENAGHELTRVGHEGGDVSDAEVVLIAVPGGAVADALESVGGLEGKTVVDATNLIGDDPPEGFSSNAEFVKSKTGGPTAKSFNL